MSPYCEFALMIYIIVSINMMAICSFIEFFTGDSRDSVLFLFTGSIFEFASLCVDMVMIDVISETCIQWFQNRKTKMPTIHVVQSIAQHSTDIESATNNVAIY